MGIFGTSQSEEQQLREASNVHETIHDQASSANLSAYATADEDLNETDEEDIPSVTDHYIDRTENGAESSETDTGSYTKEKYHDERPSNNSYPEPEYNDRNENPEGDKSANEDDSLQGIASEKLNEAREPIHVEKLDWDSPDDKANPQNWPQWKKLYITFTVALICLCVSLGSSLYVAGVPSLMVQFEVSQELCISGLTFYLIGLAVGPAIAAPMSEVFGRRWIYFFSLPISMLFAMGIGLSKHIYSILILRFFCGFFASPAMAVAGGSISDIWSFQDMGFAMALFCLAPFLGPVLGPIIGGFAAEKKGWKWTMWIYLMASGLILPFVLLLPETYKPIILAKRAKKRGVDLYKPPVNKQFFKNLAVNNLLRPVQMLTFEPIVSIFTIYIAFVFAVLFGFFEAYPIIFKGEYGMSLGVSGLPFLGVGIGLIGGVIFFIIIDKKIYNPKNPDGTRGKRDENGNLIFGPPENKLLAGKVGAICLPVALFWLAWTGRTSSVHWMAPIAAGVPFGFGLILVFFAVIYYFSMSYPPASLASALAANNLVRYLLASVFPLFTVQMYERLHIDWATSLFAFIALAMVPVPFVFQRYGAKLRGKSKFGYAALFKRIAEQKAAAAAAAAQSGHSETAAPGMDTSNNV
mmetsp:Transcript_7269/g.9206  ORF Transcript_7269/g.9206 Transcript_7269/m.9206 type:complete len:637 (+) Transcript_7269:69-1979(+)